MSATLLDASLLVAQAMLTLAMGCAAVRLLRGPRAQDRVLALDTLYVSAMLVMLTSACGAATRTTSRRQS